MEGVIILVAFYVALTLLGTLCAFSKSSAMQGMERSLRSNLTTRSCLSGDGKTSAVGACPSLRHLSCLQTGACSGEAALG